MPRGEYFLELRGGEMPAAPARRVLRQLGTRLFEELMERGLAPREVTTAFSPRRLAVCCRGLPAQEGEREEQQLGPAVAEAYDADGAPTPALSGFLERVGAEAGAVQRVRTEKGEHVAVARRRGGRPTSEVLAAVVPRLLAEVAWGRAMRWGAGRGPWIRPLYGIVSLWQGEVVPFTLHGVRAGRETAGHPVLSADPFAVRGFDDYRRRLRRLGIQPSFEARRKALGRSLAQRAAEHGAEAVVDEALLDRLAGLTEVAGVVEGSFDPEALELPEELVVAALVEQQSAVPLRRDGALLPRFLATADRLDDPEGRVRRGLEVAVAGRLADVRFFAEHDRRLPLAERSRRLDELPLGDGLGSLAAKGERLVALAELVAEELGLEAPAVEAAGQAARLAKADLTSRLVREIPVLRGVAGGLYARREGYVEAVWQALYDHYLPTTPTGPIPRHAVGRVVALADRVDALVGHFGHGAAPTGSRDPHGLRRLAHGLLRIMLEGDLALDLDLVVARAARLWGEALGEEPEAVLSELRGFLLDRLRHLLGSKGYAADEVEAVLAVRATHLPELEARVRALHAVRREAAFPPLVQAARRLHNMVKGAAEHEVVAELLVEPAEVELHRVLLRVRKAVDRAVARRRYEEALRRMAALTDPLDRFFAEVLVMDEDAERRNNRIALLQATRRLFWRTARLREVAVDPVAVAPAEG